jgi:hypothetical protein
MLTSCQCLLAGFITTYQKMDTSGYAKANTSRNTTYDAVSVNPTDERSAIHYTKDDISRMTFKTVTEWEEWYKHYSFLMGFGLRREDVRTDRNGEGDHAKMGMFKRRVQKDNK